MHSPTKWYFESCTRLFKVNFIDDNDKYQDDRKACRLTDVSVINKILYSLRFNKKEKLIFKINVNILTS